MKTIYLLCFVVLLPFAMVAQNNDYKTNTTSATNDIKPSKNSNEFVSGFSIGANTEIVLLGEFGVFGEYYFNKNSFYAQVNYNRQAVGDDDKVNVDMADNTNSYYCATGAVFRLGYRRYFHYSENNTNSYFIGGEFIYKELAYNHLIIERPSDKYYLYNEASMYSSRFGLAIRLGFRKTFTKESKAYWALSIAADGLYRIETTTLHSSKTYTEIIFNQPYTTYGFINTVSLNLALGFDFR
ncbi:MAG: hypothetical protein B6I18_03015 [Bacteroidetes bacterium 4572_112]|nr:MAG: hypothetical protein B6I18_03015 [Bacteroidetes bacterium 4572_112]